MSISRSQLVLCTAMLAATLLALGVAAAIGGGRPEPPQATSASKAAPSSSETPTAGAKDVRAARTPKRGDAFAQTAPRDAFVPPTAAEHDRVPAAPFVVMLASMVVLLLSAVPARVLADARLPSPERARAIALLTGCGGLLLALVVLLASA
jgi:hypothetical protein